MLSHFGSKTWEPISPVIQQIDSFSGFKKVIKTWKPIKLYQALASPRTESTSLLHASF